MLLILAVVIIVVFFGGGYWYDEGAYRNHGFGIGGLLLVILVLYLLFGHGRL